MKLIDHFDAFIRDVVDLNDTRIDQLDASTEALKGVIRDSGWSPTIRYFAGQGSWAHKTIIKPVDNGAFDADLLVFVAPVVGWSAKDYLSTLRSVFVGHGTYADKVKRSSHCVTIEYACERQIDIAPCVINREGFERLEVCNFNTDEFERSEPEKYTQWLIDQNARTGGNGLRKVTRLLKYLRDIKTTFTCRSVLLTTLLGNLIYGMDETNNVDFVDLPTALKTLLGRLDDQLQANESRLVVANPFLISEVLSEAWTDETYLNFREMVHTYRTWIDDAYLESDRDESIGKWRRVFGEEFAKSAVVEKAATVSDATRKIAVDTFFESGTSDLVTLFTRFGLRILPAGFDRLPHKQRPRWRSLAAPLFRVAVGATRHVTRDGPRCETEASGAGPLPKNNWLKFQARTTGGALLGAEFEVWWRVTNTDREAERANCLRGGFEPSSSESSRWERLQYRGIHTVEAFVIRKRDKVLVSQSEPFYVVIQ